MTDSTIALMCPACHRQFKVAKSSLSAIKHLPFCSERCKLLDLGKWADEEYRVEGEKAVTDNGPKTD